jgi:S1-C subfamily serine protease
MDKVELRTPFKLSDAYRLLRIAVFQNMKALYGFAPTLFGAAAVVLVQAQLLLAALTPPQVHDIAKQITVRIAGQNPGSGVIIKREGNTYTILTAQHVVATPDEYDILTFDGQRYPLTYTTVKPLPGGIDLAILEFTSTVNYQVAKLGDLSRTRGGFAVYVAGFPISTKSLSDDLVFTPGQIVQIKSQPNTPQTGYALVYSNVTQPGMSGGPVLNEAGEVIGIHGQGDRDESGKTGLNLAVPINTYISLADKVRGTSALTPIITSSQSQQSKSTPPTPFKLPADFSKTLALSPPTAATSLPGLIAQANSKFDKKDYRSAISDYSEIIRLNPKADYAYYNRGLAYSQDEVWDLDAAIADFTEAIRLNPRDSKAYSQRAHWQFIRQNYNDAIADYTQAIRLEPRNADSYLERGRVYKEMRNYQVAIADYNYVLSWDSSNARAYYLRGHAQENQNAKLRDFQKAADLAKQQGNQWLYERAVSYIKFVAE